MSTSSEETAKRRKVLSFGDRKRDGVRACGHPSISSRYSRERDLPGLLALWPEEIRDRSEAGARRMIEKLRCALRAERQRGRAGHWSYDLDRHLKLVTAFKAERAALDLLEKTGAQSPCQDR